MEDEESYAQALDAEKRPLRDISSSSFHWMWLGPVRSERFSRCARRLLRPDMMTPFGIRTLSSASANYAPQRYHRGSIWPWENWVAALALRRMGPEEQAREVDCSVLRGLVSVECPAEMYVYEDGWDRPAMSLVTFDGHPATPCTLQAWTVGYLIEMLSRYGLGALFMRALG